MYQSVKWQQLLVHNLKGLHVWFINAMLLFKNKLFSKLALPFTSLGANE